MVHSIPMKFGVKILKHTEYSYEVCMFFEPHITYTLKLDFELDLNQLH